MWKVIFSGLIGATLTVSALGSPASPSYRTVAEFLAPGAPSEFQLAYRDPAGVPHHFVGFGYPGKTAELVEFILSGTSIKTLVHKLPDDTVYSFSAYQAIHSMVLCPDAKIYLSASPAGRILQYDIIQQTFKVLGGDKLPETEKSTFPWDLTVTSTGIICGCCYPKATLFTVDPANLQVHIVSRLTEDAGARSEYARYLVAGNDGLVYIRTGISAEEVSLYSYDPKAGGTPSRVKMESHGDADLRVNQFYCTIGDKRVFAKVSIKDKDKPSDPPANLLVELVHGTAIAATALPNDALNEFTYRAHMPGLGRFKPMVAGEGKVTWMPDSGPAQTFPFDYQGHPASIFRLGTGPDNAVYVSGILPANLYRYEPGKNSHIDTVGSGEIYGIYALAGKLTMAVYGGKQPLATWSPAPSGNQNLVDWLDPGKAAPIAVGWRPQSGAVGANGKTLWVGSSPPYERKDGLLVQIDTGSTTTVARETPIANRTISSIATWSDTSSHEFLVLGTSLQVGTGAKPVTDGEGQIYRWDPLAKQIVGSGFSPVPGERANIVFNLRSLDSGTIFGMARLIPTRDQGPRFAAFVISINGDSFKTERFKILDGFKLTPELTLNSIESLGTSLYFLHNKGICAIDPANLEVTDYPYTGQTTTAGFAKRGQGLYFGAGTEMVRFGFSDSD